MGGVVAVFEIDFYTLISSFFLFFVFYFGELGLLDLEIRGEILFPFGFGGWVSSRRM